MIGTIDEGISISLRLGISRSLSVVVGIRVSSVVSSVAVIESRVSIGIGTIGTIGGVEDGGIGLRLGISRSLSVVAVGMRIAVCPVSSIGIRIGTITIGQPGISLSVSLGLWLGSGESGKANHKSELHCNLR